MSNVLASSDANIYSLMHKILEAERARMRPNGAAAGGTPTAAFNGSRRWRKIARLNCDFGRCCASIFPQPACCT